MRTLVGLPSAVRAGADGLMVRSEALVQLGNGIGGAAAQVDGAWGGPASLSFGQVAQVAAQACRGAAEDLVALAGAGRAYAGDLERDQEELMRLAGVEARARESEIGLRARATAEVAAQPSTVLALLAGGGAPPAVPPGAVSALAEAERCAQEQRSAAAQADAVWERHQGARARFVAVLEASNPAAAISAAVPGGADLATLAAAVKKSKEVKGAVMTPVTLFRAIATMRKIRNAETALADGGSAWTATDGQALAGERKAAEKALDKAMSEAKGTRIVDELAKTRLPGGGGTAAAGKMILGRLALGLTVKDGVEDVFKGDPDHPGWRDSATRFAGGVGALGAGTLLAGSFVALAPPVAAAATVAVGAYTAYKVGTWAWDHREDIKQAVSAGLDRGKEAVENVGGAIRDTAASGARDLARGVGSVAGSLRDGVVSIIPKPRWGW